MAVLDAERGGEAVQQPGFARAVRTDQQQRITVGKSRENDRLDAFQSNHAELAQDARCGQ